MSPEVNAALRNLEDAAAIRLDGAYLELLRALNKVVEQQAIALHEKDKAINAALPLLKPSSMVQHQPEMGRVEPVFSSGM